MLFPEQPYTRYRSRENSESVASTQYVHTVWNGTTSEPWKVQSNDTVSGTATSKSFEEMHDTESPAWLKLWSRGFATVNPLEHIKTFYNRGVGSYFVKRVNRYGVSPRYYYAGYQLQGTASCGNSPTSYDWSLPSAPSVDSSIIAEAMLEAWSKVSLRDTMVLATAAEMSRSLDFLISVFRRVWKIYRSLRKLDFKALYGEIKPAELSQRYMEARYALRPLMYDVRNTLSALAEKVPARHNTFRSFKADLAESTTSNFIAREVPGDWRLTGTAQAVRSLEVRAGVLTMVTAFNNFSRWGAGDILQSAWELVPFSFIVDWFFQVGKLISAWAPKIGLKTLASWYVVEDTTTLSVTAETGTSLASGYNFVNIYNRSAQYSTVTVLRYRIPNPDRPVLPSFNVKLNKLKLLDLGIIATGIYNSWFGRKGRKARPRNNLSYAWFDKQKTSVYRD